MGNRKTFPDIKEKTEKLLWIGQKHLRFMNGFTIVPLPQALECKNYYTLLTQLDTFELNALTYFMFSVYVSLDQVQAVGVLKCRLLCSIIKTVCIQNTKR